MAFISAQKIATNDQPGDCLRANTLPGNRKPRLLTSWPLLLGLAAAFTALAIQPGELGSIDTLRRLQTTRSLWTPAPTIMPGDMGILGRNARRYYWYGIGQSLLMLPADVLTLESVKLISRFREPPWWLMNEDLIVSSVTSTALCVLTVLLSFHLLISLNFTVKQSVIGACGLLFGTTFLHYTQNMQENNYLLCLTMAGFLFQYDWLRRGSIRSLLCGSIALGANLLTRLTTVFDVAAAFVFILLCLLYEEGWGRAALNRLMSYGKVCVPCYTAFFGIDRLYQYHRFGSFFTTYFHLFSQQFAGKPSPTPYVWPATTMPGFPWGTPFAVGFLGPLITPEKSIFLFDPLLVLTSVLALVLWRRLPSEIKAYILSLVFLLFSYVCFYAKNSDWSGDNAWGDRYVVTPVQMLALASLPLLIRYRRVLKSSLINFGIGIAAVSVAVQFASLFFWNSLEVWQLKTLRHPVFVVGLRVANILAFALGTADRWGLSNQYTRASPAYRMTTPYFFPFLLMKQGIVSPAKVTILIGIWISFWVVLFWMLFLIAKRVRESDVTVTEANA